MEKRDLSRPARLVNVLESIELLFQSCAIIIERPTEVVTVVACDSGSDKSFDFLGAARVMELVKDIILSMWDRIIFYRELKVAERIELIGKSLPVMDMIGVLQQEQKLGPEQAELLRRNILSGVTKFIESGATIPELEQRSHFSPGQIMSPVQKLLEAAQETTAENDSANSQEQIEPADLKEGKSDLNENEISQLRELLNTKKKDVGDTLSYDED